MKTVKFFTLGCKVNQYETQQIRERFVSAGFKEINGAEKADNYVINTCTVTSTADRKSRYFIRFAQRQNPKAKIIVTGCYTQLNSTEIAKIKGVTHIIINQDKNRITEILGNKKNDGLSSEYKQAGISGFSGHTRAFLKIQDGCNNRCSYCKVPLVRGSSRSRPLDDIIEEANRLVKNGFKEITLCGICLGSYGKDLQPKKGLIEVIDALVVIEGLLRIRLSSIEAGDVSDELINLMAKSKKLCRHLHIPMQSGSDEILKMMNRSYTRKDYFCIVQEIREQIPEVAITTDIMVGFPEENEANFIDTVTLVKEIIPARVHIFPYSQRNGTAASDYNSSLSLSVIKERISYLKGITTEYSLIYKKRFLLRDMEVLVEGRSRKDKIYWEGYTDNYIKVWIKSDLGLKNQLILVQLKKIHEDSVLADFGGT